MTRLYGTANKKVGTTLNRKSGGSERVKDVGSARSIKLKETTSNQSIAAKGSGRGRPVAQWDTLPESQKTTRNGIRYVVTYYRGKTQLTRWLGPSGDTSVKTNGDVKYSSITRAKAESMGTAELRRLLKNPATPARVTKILNPVLAKKAATKQRRA